MNVNVRAPLGSSLSATRTIIEKVRTRIAAHPEVDYTFYAIGGDDMHKVNEGSIYVRLKPKADRRAANQRSQMTLMDDLRQEFAAYQDAIVSVQKIDVMGGAAGMKTQQVQLVFSGPDFGTLETLSSRLLALLRQAGDYKDLDTTYEPGKPEAAIVVDRSRADDLGVAPSDIADTVSAAIGGTDVAKFKADGQRYDIAIRFLEHGRDDIHRLEELWVPSSRGSAVQLRTVAHVVESSVPVEINRYDRQRQITVLANLSQTKALGDAITEIDTLLKGDAAKGVAPAVTLPAGYTAVWTGNASDMAESFRNLGITMTLSVLVTYMILASQFESLVHPFTIMLSLPLAFVGALLSLVIFRQTLNIFTMMAFIFLLGLVTKNAILLIDYANELRRRDGLSRDAALRRAGPVRLRPILMTTFAMIFGMLPAAIGTGEGSESRQPMAIAIIGGLVSSTFLTLLIVPVVYSLLDPISEFIQRTFLDTHDGPGTPVPAPDGLPEPPLGPMPAAPLEPAIPHEASARQREARAKSKPKPESV
jgi:HAE1 family hydrophobic/amphiphilic exporter-1